MDLNQQKNAYFFMPFKKMKKLLPFLLTMFTVIKRSNEENNSDCSENLLGGKLTVKGICLNYTIQLVSGKIDEELTESEWEQAILIKTFLLCKKYL